MASSQVTLRPVAGFCVKSTSLQQGFYTQSSPRPPSDVLEPPSLRPIPIPQNLKIFVNVAWDSNVPPPPAGSEEIIQSAMVGEEVDEMNSGGWYVPVIVSDGRQDKDRAGKACLVFDAVYNSTLKSRSLKDSTFKAFLIELALQRIESQTSITLSRSLGFPNISSKGTLTPRTVHIPSLYSNSLSAKPLITEISSEDTSKPMGILEDTKPSSPSASTTISRPSWSWSKDDHIQITISVPNLTHTHISNAVLDLEPRRLILQIPSLYALDINFSLPDAQLAVTYADDELRNIFALKRSRELEVENAKAQWIVADGILVVSA